MNGVKLFDIYTTNSGEELILNPDKKIVEKITSNIKRNNGYCPCQVQKTHDTICPCKFMRESGTCFCNLYVYK